MRICAGIARNSDLSYPAYLCSQIHFRPAAGKYHATGLMSSSIRRNYLNNNHVVVLRDRIFDLSSTFLNQWAFAGE